MRVHCFPAVIGLLLVLIENAASWSGNVCSVRVCGWRWEWRCAYYTWNACCYWRQVRVSYYWTQYFCCPGWTTSTSDNCNVAICNPKCYSGRGTCSTPNTCTCNNPYEGQICDGISTCSFLKPCYPGACNSYSMCTCSEGFGGPGCRDFIDDTFVPTINRCNATFTYHSYSNNMDIYSYFGDATNLTEPFVLWTNQDEFNILEMTMEAIYDTEYNIQQALPPKPDYVHSMKLGIIDANVMTRHTKLGSTEYEKMFNCSQPSKDNPILNEVMVCMLNGTNDIRVDSGDVFTLKFTVTSGGVIEYQNKNNPNVITETRYYTGKTAENTVEFRFDYMEPRHCITAQTPCSDHPLHLDKDITKESIKPTWKGWTDALSGVFKYSVELWKMEFSLDFKHLREPLITETSNPVPLFIEEITNITEPLQFPMFTPTEAGIYSCILEVSDEANNTRYARRFAIYDKTSQVTVRDENPLYCMSASEPSGYKWQTNITNDINGKTRVDISWADHFVNEVHEAGHFLSPVGPYKPRLTDGGRRVNYKKIEEAFDDFEGERQRSGIENMNSIVKFEFAHQIPPVDLANIAWLTIPGLKQNHSLTLSGVNDGYVHQFFVRATDIIGNQMIDSTTIRFDSTIPFIGEPELDYNVQDGFYDFSSRFTIVSRDLHSGVPIVKVKIVTKSGTTKYEHTYSNTPTADGNCYSCYCTQGVCYKAEMTFDINNCWMGVAIDDTGNEMHRLEIAAYNGAMLSNMKTHDILNVGNLTGIQKYYGVDNLEIVSITDTTVRIKWDQPKSCYGRLGIKLMVTLGNNIAFEFKIYKDATSFDITNLQPSSFYSFQLFTKYGTDNNFVMSEPVTMSMTTTAKQVSGSGLQAGGIAGITIGFIVLVVIFVVIMIFLHRSGRLSKAQERVTTGFSTIRQTVMRAPAFDNAAYSQGVDDDIYTYGGMKFNSGSAIPRDSIAFDSEISRGRFAIIYKVYMNKEKREKETVVAKTLKDSANELDIQTMKAKIMFYDTMVGHDKNVLDFKGSVEYDVRGPFMLLEYCENGSLKDYLKIHKDQVNEDLEERLYRFSFGICMGMNYLTTKGIVHKRLAARNILLDFLLEPKIIGFGPDPASVQDNDSTSERIPVKWVAPECMTSTRKATEKSDVWSYGIVLWEIFTIGETPYPDVRSQDLPNWLKQNKRNTKPEYCDDSFFKMMKKCWQYEPNKRPSFLKLKQELSELFSEGHDDEYYYRSSAIYDNKQ